MLPYDINTGHWGSSQHVSRSARGIGRCSQAPEEGCASRPASQVRQGSQGVRHIVGKADCFHECGFHNHDVLAHCCRPDLSTWLRFALSIHFQNTAIGIGYIHIYICIHIYMYVHIYISICIHTHIKPVQHTLPLWLSDFGPGKHIEILQLQMYVICLKQKVENRLSCLANLSCI